MDHPIKAFNKIVPDAYHGTSSSNAKEIIKDNSFRQPKEEREFLGTGIYFFEGSLENAKYWARDKHEPPIAVICATINLGRCLDLNIKEHRDYIKEVARNLQNKRQITNVNVAIAIEVIFRSSGNKIDTVRAVQSPDRKTRILPKSPYDDNTRLVICVKNPESILELSLCFDGY